MSDSSALHTAELLAQITALRQEVEKLRREKGDLALILELTTEHADNTTDELQTLTDQLKKRATQLEASSQVGRQVTSILNLDELLSEVVKGIQARFSYYFVGIFISDEVQQNLFLQAGHKRNHGPQLEIGYAVPLNSPQSIIVSVCQSGKPYLATDVSIDPRYLAVAEVFPNTRSELALPLHIGPKMIGVLDIQSDQLAAFTQEDTQVLQTLADQVSIAIRNAHLYAEVKRFNEHLELLVQERTRELAQANRKLELLNKTKSDFIATLAHELRTPLTLIKGYASLLKTTVKHIPDASQLVAGILNGEERLLEVVNSILDVLKIDSQTLEVRTELLNLNMIIKVTCKEFRTVVVDRHLKLNLIGLDQLPKIQVDPDLMSKLFTHLISNAIKYTPDGGTITVKGNLIHSNPSEPTQNRWIQILVSDTGIGIDPPHQQMIFEKFYQTGPAQLHSSGKTKFKGGGPGLGLAIVKGIAEAHGGRIWVESPGYDEQSCPGSTFHLLLPLNTH